MAQWFFSYNGQQMGPLDDAAARAWAARAYAELAKDPALAGNEPARLARLKDAGGAGTTGAR